MVVMPVTMMAANRTKHCGGLYLSGGALSIGCAGDERARLDDVNLSFHVSPLDILITSGEDALDRRCRFDETANHVVRQHNAIARDRDFPNAAFFIERQQTIFRGTS